jgi:hypothetical protein
MCPATVRSFSWIHPNQNSEPYSCGPGLLPDNYRTRTSASRGGWGVGNGSPSL